MIETRRGVEQIDAILATPGLAGVYVGPSDLGLSLGFGPSFDWEFAAIKDVILDVKTAARRAGVAAGIHCIEPVYAAAMARAGFNFVTIGSDARFLAAGAQGAITAFRSEREPSA